MSNNYALNYRLMGKLLIVAAGMFAFGYMLAPIYKAICNWTGVNVLALGEREAAGSVNARAAPKSTQIDYSRTVMVEFEDRKSTRLNSSHEWISRMPSSA